jgi:DNA-binding LytR/AlgR family response regulator
MKTLNILIVEDEMLVALYLEEMIATIVPAVIMVEWSVAEAKKALDDLDFAFLDVDVTNGKTYELAQILERKHVPYAFVSGSRKDELPPELRNAPFISKPFHQAQIEDALQAVTT